MRPIKALLGMALVLAALSVGAVALAAVSHHHARAHKVTAAERKAVAASVQSVPAAEAHAFGVLRRDRDSGDALPPGLQQMGATFAEKFSANPGLARKLSFASSAHDAWVVPGDGGICIADNVGGTCASTARAEAGHLVMTESGGPNQDPGEVVVVGLVPDGVTQVSLHLRGGATKPLAVNDNAFYAKVTGGTDTIEFDGPNGHVSSDAGSYDGDVGPVKKGD
jgi:hypothetical protein